MGINSVLKIFLPKDRVFYNLFESVAAELVKMGEKLKEIVNEPDFDKRGRLIKEVEDMEHVNDGLTHRIFTELGKISSPHLTGRIFITSHQPSMILPIIFMLRQKDKFLPR